MIEERLEIRMPDGMADGTLYRPESVGSYPGVLFLTDIGGIRESFEGMAGRLAREGYTVLMPNVFYRTGKPPLFDLPINIGDEGVKKRFDELRAPLKPDAAERDAAAYVDFLAAQTSVRDAHRLGVVGYCFTGALALRTAAVRPRKILAAASFHGGGLYNSTPASPHLLLPRISARLYFAHAQNDHSMTAEAIANLNRALEAWGGRFESEIYEGARHSWTVSDSPVYNQRQAERAFEKLLELFAAELP